MVASRMLDELVTPVISRPRSDMLSDIRKLFENSRPPRARTAAMTPDEFVTMVYILALGRLPDDQGRHTWARLMVESGDPTSVLAGIVASAEATERRSLDPRNHDSSLIAASALALLGRLPRIVDIGAQSLGDGSHPYSPLDEITGMDIIGFDPLAERLAERAEAEEVVGSLTLLPFAIGDGNVHTLYVNNDDATSSLFPLNTEHNARFNHISTLETVRTERIATYPLDEVLPAGPIDFLKLDVQGAELMVLKGAQSSLRQAAVVHCEVEFSPIYRDQPLYPEIQIELAAYGFYLVDLLVPGRYHYLTESGVVAPDHLLWADAVFFRESDDAEVLAAQSLMAAAIYRKPTLAEHLLSRARVAALASPPRT
jgi:FkbM family methyltransferase